MIRLAAVLYSIIATSLAGTGVIAVLVAGNDSVPVILGAAGAGALLAVPASYLVARQITALTKA
jgi:hypothetical protein